MGRAYFITGTDTGVGKTLVTCAIARALRNRGVDVGVYKPAETGCRKVDGVFVGEDCERLAAAAASGQTPSDIASALFAVPAAPLVSAEQCGETIDTTVFDCRLTELRERFEIALVEGAGGLMVPVADNVTYLDLLRRWQIPTVVVVGSRLGCINHALLTFEVMQNAGLEIAGYVLNAVTDDGEYEVALRTNQEMIARFTNVPCVGTMPAVAAAQRDDYDLLAGLAEANLDLAAI